MSKHILTTLITIANLIFPFVLYCDATTPFEDLSDKAQNFILEEKQIIIPGYPDAFNPSIVRWTDGELLLCFRTREPLTESPHLMGFVWLNEDFEPISTPTFLKIIGGIPLKVSRAQDPRLIHVGDKFYIAYNNILSDDDIETRRMVIAPLHKLLNMFFIFEPQYLLNFSGDPKNWREKNWSPFDHKGSLLFSYSINPHRVLKPTLTDETCFTMAITKANISWSYGELRGGTPALLDGDEYLAFFHSYLDMKSIQSNGKKISHYFMGAYRFNAEAPYNLTHISPEPIYGSQFYTSPDYPTWKPLRVVFPGGFVMNDDYVWVVYGRQDHECWVVKLDKQGLMDSLVPLQTVVIHD